ncbi:MAG: prepilin-type N-terminal cleavage/methylation domain-containing protein [Alkalimonas sp.]|nr:prepilin-type N-terminal cleavage/methylation domain-containing protein [Alkalimonas sp.]
MNRVDQYGFTLVELMVALVLTSLLMLGVGGAYMAINQTVQEVQSIENAQEVIRSSQLLLSRSIHRADSMSLSGDELHIHRLNSQASELDCRGMAQASAFTEAYRFAAGELQCRVDGDSWTPLLTGLSGIEFIEVGMDLLRVRIAPEGLPEHFPQADLNGDGVLLPYIRLDLALKTQILIRES